MSVSNKNEAKNCLFVSKAESADVDIKTSYCLSTPVPAYLRFDTVKLIYDSIQSFEQMKLHLQHLKNALIGAKFSIRCSFDYYDGAVAIPKRGKFVSFPKKR